MPTAPRGPWTGRTRTLLVSIDIGTTYTASSFCILQPGVVPKFEEILRWPRQAISSGKVPSAVLYDHWGMAAAFAAETEDDEMMVIAEEQDWNICSWWKLRLRPPHLPLIADLDLPPLPEKVHSVDIVLTDFLRYMKKCIQEFVINGHGDGQQLWDDVYPGMHVVLTTPNGWEGAQQQRMRAAAQTAGLVSGNGGQRIHFVTEAEAAILYAVDSGCIESWLYPDAQVTLCDCGGGTVDITTYRVSSTSPLRLQEATAAGCYLAGAIFVTNACRAFLQKHLKNSEWDDPEIIKRAVEHFDANGKRKFESSSSPAFVDVGGHKSSPSLGITRGKLKIPGNIAATFFEHSLATIKQGVQRANHGLQGRVQNVILVGGLVSSPYIHNQLSVWGSTLGISFSRPDGPMTKAVANGALAWYIDNPISARVSKHHYGVEISIPFDPNMPDMAHRVPFRNKQGEMRVESAWHSIVAKNAVLQAGQEVHHPYRITWSEDQISFRHTSELYIHRGPTPGMFISPPDSASLYPGLEIICSVYADLEAAFEAAPTIVGKDGRKFRDVSYEVCMTFGDTELVARLRWKSGEHEWSYGAAVVSHAV